MEEDGDTGSVTVAKGRQKAPFSVASSWGQTAQYQSAFPPTVGGVFWIFLPRGDPALPTPGLRPDPPCALGPGEAAGHPGSASGGSSGFQPLGLVVGHVGAPGLCVGRVSLLSPKHEFVLCHQLWPGSPLGAGALSDPFLNGH